MEAAKPMMTRIIVLKPIMDWVRCHEQRRNPPLCWQHVRRLAFPFRLRALRRALRERASCVDVVTLHGPVAQQTDRRPGQGEFDHEPVHVTSLKCRELGSPDHIAPIRLGFNF